MYADDKDAPNAAFTADLTFRPAGWTIDAPRDGIVLIGTHLIAEMRNYFGSLSAPLTALCGHEAGHALQAKHGLVDWHLYAGKPKDDFYPDRYELCADFICGYYGAHRRKIDKSYRAAIQAATQFSKGDHKPIGHGTPAQRGKAVEAGFQFGNSGVQDSKAAVEAGLQYVLGVDFTSK
ncbi:hypothetical protein NKI51_30425 [Mesorhizobium australicum]|uniref:hypothetical protein n=1 Tax=Mesorhizobium australicum TaxID=536018 RepID=UPI00333A7F7F